MTRSNMKDGIWKAVVLSDVGYEHLVAEVSYGDQFLLLLDREQGPGAIYVAFPRKDGSLGPRILLSEFVETLEKSAVDLCR